MLKLNVESELDEHGGRASAVGFFIRGLPNQSSAEGVEMQNTYLLNQHATVWSVLPFYVCLVILAGLILCLG